MTGLKQHDSLAPSLVLRMRTGLLSPGVILCLCCLSCSKREADDKPDPNLAAKGNVEVTAELVEIIGLEEWDNNFPSNDLDYDYTYVMKYRVLNRHRGEVARDTILVAHYNPLKLRAEAADERCPDIGGNVTRFRAGDVHRMALGVPLDEHFMGPMINKYFGQDEGPLHFAIWTSRGAR